jgi:hypothetical protein
MANRYEVKISDGRGGWIVLKLARNQGQPVWRSTVIDPLTPSVPSGEASYVSFTPRVSGVYVQPDLSDGVGQKFQVPSGSPDSKRYFFAENVDASIPGHIQRGPAVTSYAPPANADYLTGSYVLGDVIYFVLGRIVVQFAGGTLTAVKDFGAGESGYTGARFYQLGTTVADGTSTHATEVLTLDSPADRIAQKVTPTQTAFLDQVTLYGGWTGASAATGDVNVTLQTDYEGGPSGNDIASVSKKIASLTSVATSLAGASEFYFLPDQPYLQIAGEPYWVVIDAPGATTALGVVFVAGTSAATSYTGGTYAQSSDDGEKWTVGFADLAFNAWTRPIGERGFIGRDSSNTMDVANTTTFTSDATYKGKVLVTHGNTLFRDCQSSTNAAVSYSYDGVNWEEAVLAGDPTNAINAMYTMQDCVLIATNRAIWAMSLPNGTDTPSVSLVYKSKTTTTANNGRFGCIYKTAALIPYDNRLLGIDGTLSGGFTIHENIGVSLDESGPGVGTVTWAGGWIEALAAGTDYVYAAYRLNKTFNRYLFKSDRPLEGKWHGSIADLGAPLDPTPIFVWGTSLYFATGAKGIGQIVLPDTKNPAAGWYSTYDTTHTSYLYFPIATGNFEVTQKAWLAESVTFDKEVAGGRVTVEYDLQDGLGWRYLGSLYQTGELYYPQGLKSRLLARRLRLDATTALDTKSQIVAASGLTFALRSGVVSRELRFTVELTGNQSAATLGAMPTIGYSSRPSTKCCSMLAKRVARPWLRS